MIGSGTSVQDNAVLHTTPEWPTVVGDDCVLGHRIHLEGCTLENDVLIGNHAQVLHRSIIRTGAIVAANSVVLAGRGGAVGCAGGRVARPDQARSSQDRRHPRRRRRVPATHASCIEPDCGDSTDGRVKSFTSVVAADDAELAADRLWQLGVEAVGVDDSAAGTVELWTSVGDSAEAIRRAARALDPTWHWEVRHVSAPAETWRDHVGATWYDERGVVVPAWQVDHRPSPKGRS